MSEQDVEQIYLIKNYREQYEQRAAMVEARRREQAQRAERDMVLRAAMEAERHMQEQFAADRAAREEDARRQMREVEAQRVTYTFSEAELRAANPHQIPPPSGWSTGMFDKEECVDPIPFVNVCGGGCGDIGWSSWLS